MERLFTAIGNRQKKGFTLVEILVIAPIFLVAITLMGSTLIKMYGNVVVESRTVLLRTESQKISAVLRSDLVTVNSFATSILPTLTDPNQPESGWIYNTQPSTLITKSTIPEVTSDSNSLHVTTMPDCVDPAFSQAIYFTKDNASGFKSLFRRTIAPARDTICGTISAETTCPADTNDKKCQNDELISARILDFTVAYLDESGTEIDVMSPQSDLTPESARSVKITITIGEVAYGKQIKETATLQVRRHGR
jgi:type II secretory pathway pseudopilin PulG